ncbi:MAG TPA: RDD family protein [bacterium]|nr:RDD family protein [bacterium]
MKKAGFGKRLIASLIDGIFFGFFDFALRDTTIIILIVAYETILISQWNGQTIGKKIMGIRVLDDQNRQLNWLKAFIRSVSKLLSAAAAGLGFFWMLWDEKSQTWHDKIADTFVVEV